MLSPLCSGTLRWGLGEVLAGISSAPQETGVSWGQPQRPVLMQEPPGHVFSKETWMSVSQRSPCTLEQLGHSGKEPQGGPFSEPSAPILSLLLAAWPNEPLGDQQSNWKPFQSQARHHLIISNQRSGGNRPFSSTGNHSVLLCSS